MKSHTAIGEEQLLMCIHWENRITQQLLQITLPVCVYNGLWKVAGGLLWFICFMGDGMMWILCSASWILFKPNEPISYFVLCLPQTLLKTQKGVLSIKKNHLLTMSNCHNIHIIHIQHAFMTNLCKVIIHYPNIHKTTFTK